MDSWNNIRYAPIDKSQLHPVGDPLYPGSPIRVIQVVLQPTVDNEEVLGCKVYHISGTIWGESLDPSKPFRENLIEALKQLAKAPKLLKLIKKSRGSHPEAWCIGCRTHNLVRLFRVSEDYDLCRCLHCLKFDWASWYHPPRRLPPFSFGKDGIDHESTDISSGQS